MTYVLSGIRPLFCSNSMYQERLKKRMLLAEQNRLHASSSMIFASAAQNMPAGRNSDEIILLSGMERQSTEIIPCFVPLQNIQRSTPATPRCSTDELEAISSLVGLGVK